MKKDIYMSTSLIKKLFGFLTVLAIIATCHTAFAVDAPVLTMGTSGPDVSLSWTTVPGATGYKLYYAPSLNTGIGSIGSVDMGTDTAFSSTLWAGASFYVAVTATMHDPVFSESGYSNIELVTIQDPDAGVTETKTIGVTLPLTGDSPVDTLAQESILDIAVSDVNNYLASIGAGLNIAAEIKDTENSAEGVANAINYFEASGVDCIVSSGISDNIFYAKSVLADYTGLLIHTTSTSTELAEEDNLFRFISNDTITATAILQQIWDDGKKNIIIVYRDDGWGKGISETIEEKFTASGGSVLATLSYSARLIPDSIPETVELVDAQINEALKTIPSNELALVVMSFTEMTDILSTATGHDMLNLPWYGSDGTVLNDSIISGDPAVAENALKTELSSPVIRIAESDEFTQLKEQVESDLGYAPRANNYILYDAVFAAALTLHITEGNSAEKLKTALETVVAGNNFITGDMALDENGDRSNCDYDFYQVTEQNGEYLWQIIQ